MNRSRPSRSRQLLRLCRLHGVQTSFVDTKGVRRYASAESLTAVLASLGIEADTAPLPLSPSVDPVVVAWEGKGGHLALDEGAFPGRKRLDASLHLEDGQVRQLSWRLDDRASRIRSDASVVQRLPLPSPLPLGYHRLFLDSQGDQLEILVIAAPRKSAQIEQPMWGAFLPLYALRSEQMWGIADLGDLERMGTWLKGLGASAFGTLPLLASFLEGPLFEPSPYAPVSRLAWNELYVDPRQEPQLQRSGQARAIVESPEYNHAVEELNRGRLVDYRRAYALKRRVLEQLAEESFAEDASRQSIEGFAAEHPTIVEYARFRAATEKAGKSWDQWPDGQREGRLGPADYDERTFRYHLYAQQVMERQLARTAESVRPLRLYLDLPVGVHAAGFDSWMHQDIFARGISAGAPPDDFFTGGQNWGFPPFNPRALRRGRYDYFRQVLQTHLRHAGALRIDHVMGLHRIYCVPSGFPASDGAYVRYRAEELYAILALESARRGACLFGEDLGTVPTEVRRGMKVHGIGGMYVAEFELLAGRGRLPPVPSAAVASVSTHDTPPFARYWSGVDIDDRGSMGLLDREAVQRERREREELLATASNHAGTRGPGDLLVAIHDHLARSTAALALVSLEDLWLEEEPQNVPGTSSERSNWCRRARVSLESMRTSPAVVQALARVHEARKGQ